MYCPRCQTDNRAGRKFCAACGQALTITCPHCAFVNEPDDRFCGGCGQALRPTTSTPASAQERTPRAYTPKHLADKILTARSALEGERKQVTVLFADTAGFVALAKGLDPEVVHEVMDHCFGLITAEVHRFEGTINQYTGDGIMALFGAPIAHEDSPRRAVHAALGMQRAIQDFSRELQAQRGFSLQMRIGMNTGLVVVGRIGDDLRMDYTAVGDTTNLAARLQQLAQPGTVVISEATHKLVAAFSTRATWGSTPSRGIRSRCASMKYCRRVDGAPVWRWRPSAASRRASGATGSWRCSWTSSSRRKRAMGRRCPSLARRALASRALF